MTPLAFESLLYGAYTLIAFGLIAWGLLSAIKNRHAIGLRNAGVFCLVAALLLPIFVATTLGNVPGYAFLLPLAPLLPLLALACAWMNATQLPELGGGGRTLVATTCIWNLVLFVAYTMRALLTLFQIELGPFSSTVLGALATCQHNVRGSAAGLDSAIWLYLPILVPPYRHGSLASLGSASLGSFAATFMAGLFFLALPSSVPAATQEATKLAPRSDIATSIAVAECDWSGLPEFPESFAIFGRTPRIEERIDRAKEIGIEAIELELNADTIGESERFERFAKIAGAAKRAGLARHVVITAPRIGVRMHALRYRELLERAHWAVAETIRPELLVLYSQPFGARSQACVGQLGADKWLELIEHSTKAIREGMPSQRVGIDLAPPSAVARELFAKLGERRLVDRIRFVIDGDRLDHSIPGRDLLEVASWLTKHPTRAAIGIVAHPPSPLRGGGYAMQSDFVRRVLSFAAEQPLVSSIGLGTLVDGRRRLNGYWNVRDLPRPSAALMHELLRSMKAPQTASPAGR